MWSDLACEESFYNTGSSYPAWVQRVRLGATHSELAVFASRTSGRQSRYLVGLDEGPPMTGMSMRMSRNQRTLRANKRMHRTVMRGVSQKRGISEKPTPRRHRFG